VPLVDRVPIVGSVVPPKYEEDDRGPDHRQDDAHDDDPPSRGFVQGRHGDELTAP
jgi:hypothetical protein